MDNNLENDIMTTAASFVENFSDKGNFDYSVESLKALDAILDELSEFDLDEDILSSASSMAGCYVFEVARRNYGGVYGWSEERDQPYIVTGAPDYSVCLLAFEKVRGRLVNGKEDAIPFYFDGFIAAVEKGKVTPGYQATIV
jgi:hypothetical protein